MRGYSFDASKVGRVRPVALLAVTSGQIEYEWQHLLRKLSTRSPAGYRQWRSVRSPELHPLFTLLQGAVEQWERGAQG